MNKIDFLPQKYRDQDTRRKASLWRLIVVVLFGGAIASASLAQLAYQGHVRRQLDQVQPQYAQAQAKSTYLSNLQKQLEVADAAATLYAFLKSPWPRTQVLAAVVQSLDGSTKMEELHLSRQTATPSGRSSQAGDAEQNEADDSSTAELSAASRDLLALRDDENVKQTVGHVTGITTTTAAVHDYLQQLENSPLIGRVRLVSLENITSPAGIRQLRFTAQFTLRPAYGWPGAATEAVGLETAGQPPAAGNTL